MFRRRRAVALLVVAAVIGVVWLAVLGATSLIAGSPSSDGRASAATAAAAPAAAEAYVVQPGDTLWVVAQRLHPRGDVRAVVDELADRAGGATLQPGQRIDVSGLPD